MVVSGCLSAAVVHAENLPLNTSGVLAISGLFGVSMCFVAVAVVGSFCCFLRQEARVFAGREVGDVVGF